MEQSRVIEFEIPGPVRGKGRPRFARAGAFTRTYTDAKTASYESDVKVFASHAMAGADPLDEGVRVEITIHRMAPRSWGVRRHLAAIEGRTIPTGKPDCDNVAKIICDGMIGIVYTDDRLVSELLVLKRFAGREYAHVKVICIKGSA